MFVLLFTLELRFGVVVVLPVVVLEPLSIGLEFLVALVRLDTLVGLALLPELLETSGRYTLTERPLTDALPALPEFVTFLTVTLLPELRSTSCLLGPL